MASFESVVTVPDLTGSIVPSSEDVPAVRADDEVLQLRYTLGDKLGEGGMGIVHACRDRRIGRDVALKMVRSEHGARGDLVARFLREACVQGQLEHPAIVPVYDLGRDPDGKLYFTMKRVRGATFEQIFAALREENPHAVKQFSRRRLLTAFASICQALHFAHARGVIHRDLKPGNIMLGDFGEVYLLDWGLAKLQSGPELAPSLDAVSGGHGPGARSLHGATMGTPGYMAPEQVRGEAVDARSDVYALGALLFELLALEPLHPTGAREASFASTMFGPDARPSVRAPKLDLPPELDAICARATALDPRDRFASAKELVEAVERFLDGDRDLQIRRERAADHARIASEYAEIALTSGAGANATEARGRALRDAGRAIALDPTNSDAVGTLIRLLTDPPREVPAEALAELERERVQSLDTGDRIASRGFLGWFLLAPMALFMGVRSWPAALLSTGAWMVAAAIPYFTSRQTSRPHAKANFPMLISGAFAIGCTSVLFGPYFFLPGFAVIFGMMFVLVPPDRSRRGVVVLISMLTIALPALLEWLGLIPQPYELGADRIVIHTGMLHFPPLATELFLLVSSLSVVLTACMMTARVHDALAQAQERLHIQAWQLRQMLPRAARAAATEVSEP